MKDESEIPTMVIDSSCVYLGPPLSPAEEAAEREHEALVRRLAEAAASVFVSQVAKDLARNAVLKEGGYS